MALEYFYIRRKENEEKRERKAKNHYAGRYEVDYVRLKWVVVIFSFSILVWLLFVSQVFVVKDIIYEGEPSEPIVKKIETLRGRNILLLKTD